MSTDTDTDGFEVLPEGSGPRAVVVPTAKLVANVHRAAEYPGRPCILYTFATRATARSRARRLRDEHDWSQYPGLRIQAEGFTIVAEHPKKEAAG